jgi:tetratricopeptide (TPR) repeat protein
MPPRAAPWACHDACRCRSPALWAAMVALVGVFASAASAEAPAAVPAPSDPAAPAVGPRTCAGVQVMEDPGPDPVAQSLRHYVRGRFMMSNQEATLAVPEFRQAAAVLPNVARIWSNLGTALYSAGNVSAAIEALDKALTLDPADPATLYLRGSIAAGLGDTKPALDLFARLVASARKGSAYHILGIYHLARTSQDSGDVDGAIRNYEVLLPYLADPQGFYQRYPELFLIFRSQLQLKQTLGQLYLQKGDNDKAIEVLRDALGERPENTDLMGLMCTAFIQKKDFATARDWAKKVIDARPDGGVGYQRLAEVYRAEGKVEAVIPELEAYRREHPANRLLAFQLASAYEAAGRKEDAAAVYRNLSTPSEKAPGTSAAAALKLAEIQIQEGRTVDALETLGLALAGEVADTSVLVRAAQLIDSLKDRQTVYRQAQRLVADDQKAYGPFVLVGMLAESLKRIPEAIALYDKALDRQPKAAIACSRKADLLIDADRHEEALAVYRKAVAAGLNLPVFHRKIGMLLEHLGRQDEALAEYRLARKAAPEDKPARYLLAGLLGRLGKFDEAEAELKALVGRWPGEIQGYCQLAVLYLSKGDLAEAEKTVLHAQALDEEAVNPKALLAEIRYRQKRFEDAEKIARAVLAAHADDHEVRLLLAQALAARRQFKEAVTEVRTLLVAEPENITWWYFLAGLHAESGDTAAAEQALQRILKKKPDHAPSNNDLGYMWADRGVNLGRAEEMIRQALKADPQSAAYLDSLGWLFYKKGRFEDAVRSLEDATRRSPDLDAVLWDHLGDAYWQLKRQADAVKAWQTAAKILEGRGDQARPEDKGRLDQKVKNSQSGAAPAVAPTAPKDEIEKSEARTQPAPQP